MAVESTAIKNAITRVRSMFRAYPSPMGIFNNTTRVQAYPRYRTGSKLLASWPYPCSLAGLTFSPLRVCPARLHGYGQLARSFEPVL